MVGLPTFEELTAAPGPPIPILRRSFTTIEAVPNSKHTKVASYCRVSTDHESQKSSIAIQQQHFLSQAALHEDWEFAGIYCDIVSGTKKEKRPELQRLLKDCEEGRVDLVLTKSISRFARNTTDLLEMVRSLSGLGVGIVFERENIDTRTMESEFLMTLLASLAEDESHSISSNCRWGIQKRFRDGSYRISTAPYGYDVADGKLVVNEGEAQVVRWIFESYSKGQSLHRIAEDLNRRDIPTKRSGEVWKNGRNVSGLWDSTAIGRMLDSVTYTGDMILQKTYKDDRFIVRRNSGEYPKVYSEDNHPAIVGRELFKTVAKMREGKRGRSTIPRKYSLSGKLKCGCCGSTLRRQKGRGGRISWICAAHRLHASDCSLPPVSEESIKAAFTEILTNGFPAAWDYKTELEEKWREETDACELEKRVLEAENALDILERDRSRMTAAEYIESKNRLRVEREEARSALYLIKDNRIEQTEELIRQMKSWNGSSLFYEDAFRQTVERVTVYGKNEFVFHFKCGLEMKGETVNGQSKDH